MTDTAIFHPTFELTAQTFAQGSGGTGYLVGPGIILTALHCVIADVVPDDGVTCDVRMFADRPRSNSPITKWTWLPARLAWPKAGAHVDDCDIAVLVVDERHRTESMKQSIEILTHIPERPLEAEAVGYPEWKKDGSLEQYAPHRARGKLESEQSFDQTPNDFHVSEATPPEAEEWRGISGGLLFKPETPFALGIVSTRAKSKNNSLLGATLFRKVASDDTFWAVTGLARPTRDDAVLRRRSGPQAVKRMLPSGFLHLFDRNSTALEDELSHRSGFRRCTVPVGHRAHHRQGRR